MLIGSIKVILYKKIIKSRVWAFKDINVFYLNLRLVKEIIEKDDLIVLCLYIRVPR